MKCFKMVANKYGWSHVTRVALKTPHVVFLSFFYDRSIDNALRSQSEHLGEHLLTL